MISFDEWEKMMKFLDKVILAIFDLTPLVVPVAVLMGLFWFFGHFNTFAERTDVPAFTVALCIDALFLLVRQRKFFDNSNLKKGELDDAIILLNKAQIDLLNNPGNQTYIDKQEAAKNKVDAATIAAAVAKSVAPTATQLSFFFPKLLSIVVWLFLAVFVLVFGFLTEFKLLPSQESFPLIVRVNQFNFLSFLGACFFSIFVRYE